MWIQAGITKTGKLRSERQAAVEAGLTTLNAEMQWGAIDTSRRIAAFLTTLGFESMWEYDIEQFNDDRLYKGRGYIQLTGSYNYDAVGKYFGVDLLAEPARAATLELSAPIARWYWTKARPRCNEYADNLQMGKINGAIGFPVGTGASDALRCRAFAETLRYFTGEVPDGISCVR